MNGVGQQFLPTPRFSLLNPYWWDPREKYTFLDSNYRPRPTAQDFLYASTWEIWRRDNHMAYCVRTAIIRTVRINWRVGIARQVRNLLSIQKETQGNAKTA